MKRSKHSLSNYKLLTCDMGELVPVNLMEVIPGDTIQQATSALIRCNPLVRPVMHPVHVRLHHWYIPFRLIWEDFEDFITGGSDGNDATVFPTVALGATDVDPGTLADYLGVPDHETGTLTTNVLPFRAYDLVWNEWYRDPDLHTALTISTASGTDSTTDTGLQNVCWEKDYFTTARAYTQKGDEVTLPLGTEAPIFGDNMDFDAAQDSGNFGQVRDASGGSANLRSLLYDGSAPGADRIYGASDASGTGELKADLSGATAASINDLREAFALQRYKEARLRYGSRYTEYLRYLGVRSSDARLSRPEYLGGGKQTIQFSEVLQTGVDSTDAGLGNLGGHGIGAMRSNRYRRFIEEHGFILTLMSVKPKTIYSQGLNKLWNKRSKEDFFQKELQFIGQEAILNKEVYVKHTTPEGTFGYNDRYDDYRRVPSTIAGGFKTSDFEDWHMARVFTGDPALNSTFVEANPTKRVFASTSTDGLLVMAQNSIQARRMVAKTGTPQGL